MRKIVNILTRGVSGGGGDGSVGIRLRRGERGAATDGGKAEKAVDRMWIEAKIAISKQICDAFAGFKRVTNTSTLELVAQVGAGGGRYVEKTNPPALEPRPCS